ncbi:MULTISPECIES: hypothetical protein [Halalkalibacter]|uniref:Amino acid permease n=1 Tax=Halalkalibacter alkaliphilus TaxID=2917993 RepID=A0A9X2CT95_9BACI|nr:hypothetical protein [Halalkalibacter alkaliphilus]MCL7747911.1 hypothetical protein [Halalkalibacter alkaliphilus]
MLDWIMIVITIVVISFSTLMFMKRRRNTKNIHGAKGWVTPVCMLLMPVFALVVHLLDLVGIISWAGLLGLLFVAAYYTKYLPVTKDRAGSR